MVAENTFAQYTLKNKDMGRAYKQLKEMADVLIKKMKAEQKEGGKTQLEQRHAGIKYNLNVVRKIIGLPDDKPITFDEQSYQLQLPTEESKEWRRICDFMAKSCRANGQPATAAAFESGDLNKIATVATGLMPLTLRPTGMTSARADALTMDIKSYQLMTLVKEAKKQYNAYAKAHPENTNEQPLSDNTPVQTQMEKPVQPVEEEVMAHEDVTIDLEPTPTHNMPLNMATPAQTTNMPTTPSEIQIEIHPNDVTPMDLADTLVGNMPEQTTPPLKEQPRLTVFTPEQRATYGVDTTAVQAEAYTIGDGAAKDARGLWNFIRSEGTKKAQAKLQKQLVALQGVTGQNYKYGFDPKTGIFDAPEAGVIHPENWKQACELQASILDGKNDELAAAYRSFDPMKIADSVYHATDEMATLKNWDAVAAPWVESTVRMDLAIGLARQTQEQYKSYVQEEKRYQNAGLTKTQADDLVTAVRENNMAGLDTLLAQNAEIVQAYEQLQKQPILFDAQSPEMVDKLVTAGADVNARATNQDTSLFVAKNVEVAKRLVAHGADYKATNRNGTVLMRAIAANHPTETITFLATLDYTGSKHNQWQDNKLNEWLFEDEANRTAYVQTTTLQNAVKQLGAALDTGDTKTIDTILNSPLAQKAVNGDYPHVGHPILFAAKDVETAQKLVAAGANIQVKDISDRTALHLAQTPELITYYQKQGLDVNATDITGATPLFFAGQAGRTEALLKAGANPDRVDNDGNSALAMALTNGDKDAIIALALQDYYDLPEQARQTQNSELARWLENPENKTAYDLAVTAKETHIAEQMADLNQTIDAQTIAISMPEPQLSEAQIALSSVEETNVPIAPFVADEYGAKPTAVAFDEPFEENVTQSHIVRLKELVDFNQPLHIYKRGDYKRVDKAVKGLFENQDLMTKNIAYLEDHYGLPKGMLGKKQCSNANMYLFKMNQLKKQAQTSVLVDGQTTTVDAHVTATGGLSLAEVEGLLQKCSVNTLPYEQREQLVTALTTIDDMVNRNGPIRLEPTKRDKKNFRANYIAGYTTKSVPATKFVESCRILHGIDKTDISNQLADLKSSPKVEVLWDEASYGNPMRRLAQATQNGELPDIPSPKTVEKTEIALSESVPQQPEEQTRVVSIVRSTPIKKPVHEYGKGYYNRIKTRKLFGNNQAQMGENIQLLEEYHGLPKGTLNGEECSNALVYLHKLHQVRELTSSSDKMTVGKKDRTTVGDYFEKDGGLTPERVEELLCTDFNELTDEQKKQLVTALTKIEKTVDTSGRVLLNVDGVKGNRSFVRRGGRAGFSEKTVSGTRYVKEQITFTGTEAEIEKQMNDLKKQKDVKFVTIKNPMEKEEERITRLDERAPIPSAANQIGTEYKGVKERLSHVSDNDIPHNQTVLSPPKTRNS